MTAVGVRAVKAHLSQYLRYVKKGEMVAITERGKKIAILMPIRSEEENPFVLQLLQEGRVSWEGGLPQGLKKRIMLKGKPLSQTILEERE
ncbi:MAG: type II toxin-antitoxin system prevent-host-death family antitoxin [Chlamydiae bacterium]|nr:type II toxin-antitoxin system prevent-host-death family antitoxin [Chlamydiota bacterium]MBI3266459.1 type II toxin-antitoxin system prevent-host-death family antitoxin [Chlamydiota bacterium]